MPTFKIHGNHHGGIHGGKEIVQPLPQGIRIEIRHHDRVLLHTDQVTLEDGTIIEGPIIHAFIEGPGCV